MASAARGESTHEDPGGAPTPPRGLAAAVDGARADLLNPEGELLLDAAPPFGAGARVLQLNAGAGLLSRGLLARVEAVWGGLVCVDTSPTLLRLAPAGCARVVADSAALPFASGAFDAVLGADQLGSRARTPARLAELARIVRVGGAITLTVPLEGTLAELRELVVEACERAGDEAALRARLLDAERDQWTAPALEAALARAPFTRPRPIAVEDRALRFSSGQALVDAPAVRLAVARQGGPLARVLDRSAKLRAEVARLFDVYFDGAPKTVRMCTGVLHLIRA